MDSASSTRFRKLIRYAPLAVIIGVFAYGWFRGMLDDPAHMLIPMFILGLVVGWALGIRSK